MLYTIYCILNTVCFILYTIRILYYEVQTSVCRARQEETSRVLAKASLRDDRPLGTSRRDVGPQNLADVPGMWQRGTPKLLRKDSGTILTTAFNSHIRCYT